MTPLSHSFDWRGRTVAWDRLGDGPPLVLLHGTPWSSELWRPVARVLARTHTVYLWDMPGYGQSSMHPDHAVDIGVQAELTAMLQWGPLRRAGSTLRAENQKHLEYVASMGPAP